MLREPLPVCNCHLLRVATCKGISCIAMLRNRSLIYLSNAFTDRQQSQRVPSVKWFWGVPGLVVGGH